MTTITTQNLPLYPPDYMTGFPHMSGFVSNTDYDLGWISGLHKTAATLIKQIYGSFEGFQLNPDNFTENLNFDSLEESPGALIYISVWSIVALLFTVTGICWCCCNKCICCCRSGFQRRKRDVAVADDDDDYDDGDDDDEREARQRDNSDSNTWKKAIFLTLMMVIWLALLFLIIVYTFGANEETNKAIAHIEVDIDNGFKDADNFLDTVKRQILHLLGEGLNRFEAAVRKTVDACTDNSGLPINVCDGLSKIIGDPLANATEEFKAGLKELENGLNQVQGTLKETKVWVDDHYKDILTQANAHLYAFFTIFNLIYCVIFALVAIGMILAVLARSDGLKICGYLTIRGAIVLMFLFVFVIVIQMLLMFSVGGITTQILCPALRRLETKNYGERKSNQEMRQGIMDLQIHYKLPRYGEIMQSCKRDESAYQAFNLVTAYDIRTLQGLVADFFKLAEVIPSGEAFPPIPPPTTASPGEALPPKRLNPKETIDEIISQINYFVKFVIDAVEKDVGRCKPAYNAVKAVISIFCDKTPAPMTASWFILQFLPPVFFAIIVTALFFERMHF